MQDRQAIIDTLNVPYLQRMTRRLIDMYRSKQERHLSELYAYLFPAPPMPPDGQQQVDPRQPTSVDFKKQFITLIKLFHPDTYNLHRKQIVHSNSRGTEASIEFYRKFIGLETRIKVHQLRRQRIIRDAFSEEEVYAFEEDSNVEEYFEADILAEKSTTQNVYSIISSLYLGNNFTEQLNPLDLEQIVGELILSNSEIEDLDGIQYCTHLKSLDLSGNQIDSIYELRFLEDLEELDISYNHIYAIEELAYMASLKVVYLDGNSIEDISPLLELHFLEFVGLIGNPLNSMHTIDELQENGVVVVYF